MKPVCAQCDAEATVIVAGKRLCSAHGLAESAPPKDAKK